MCIYIYIYIYTYAVIKHMYEGVAYDARFSAFVCRDVEFAMRRWEGLVVHVVR